jgi:hypothetical protein
LVLKPVRDELPIYMDIDLSEWSVTQIHELVRRIRRDNNDLACVRFQRSGSNGEGGDASLYDKDFLVGMLVKSYTTAGRHESSPPLVSFLTCNPYF